MNNLNSTTNAERIKASNPKDRLGIKKVPQSVLPSGPIMEMGLGMLEGALKYGAFNYRKIGVRASVYYDAAERHLKAWFEGEDIDPDSGLPHIIKAACCLLVLRDAQIVDNWVDDRPPSYKNGWQQELNQHAAKLIEQYPNPKEAFIKEQVRPSLFDSIKHGSEEHQVWLKEAIEAYNNNQPIPNVKA